MAHNLYEKLDGKAAMFSYKERPWHGLGTILDNPATAHEAITAAGLDYDVNLRPAYTLDNAGGIIEIPGKRAVVNTENQVPLGVVGSYYRPIQNRDAFGFFDSVVGEGQALYHTAGALGDGERVWILAKLPGDMTLLRGDTTEKFLALMNAHDGSSALRMFFTPVRIVCQNTLTAALGDRKALSEGVVIRHSGDVRSKIEAAREALNLAVGFYDKFESAAQKFVAHRLTAGDIDEFLKSLVPDGSLSPEAVEEARLTVGFLAQNGRGQKGVPEVQGTAWGYLNGATEYADYYRRGMSREVNAGRKLESRWFGTSAKFKARAFNLLGDLVGIN
jgi:phage/plasmid-like protein (TIGR03299 family)